VTKTLVKLLLWLLMATCVLGWGVTFMALAVSSGSPHFAGSGWSQARIDEYTHQIHVATVLLFVLPAVLFVIGLSLFLLRDRDKAMDATG